MNKPTIIQRPISSGLRWDEMTERISNSISSGGLAHHSKQFVKGYNEAFTHGPCP